MKLHPIENPRCFQGHCRAVGVALVIDVSHSHGVVQLHPDQTSLEKHHPMSKSKVDCLELQHVNGKDGLLEGPVTLNGKVIHYAPPPEQTDICGDNPPTKGKKRLPEHKEGRMNYIRSVTPVGQVRKANGKIR